MEEINDIRFKEHAINFAIPFSVMLRQAGLDHSVSYDYKIFCPFHDNFDSPSAKLYQNPDGDSLYCYSERRIYRPIDVIKKGLLCKNIDSLFQKLWNTLSENDKEKIKFSYDHPIDIIPDKWKEHKDDLLQFRRHEVSYTNHLIILLRALREDKEGK